MSDQPIAIIGGGITGLTAAYRLAQAGRSVRLFEAAPRLGGSIWSKRAPDGWLIEGGPNSLLVKTSELLALIEQLGLGSRIQTPNPAASKRYLVRGGRLIAAPSSAFGAVTTPLLSFGLKTRILREVFFARRRTRPADVSLAQFSREHFGSEFIDYLLNPLVAGIYAGDPEKLSARLSFPNLWEAEQTHGSIIRGQLAQSRARRAAGGPKLSLISFAEGLQAIPDALVEQLPRSAFELSATIESITPLASTSSAPLWQLRWSRDGRTCTENVSRILLALPAAALAQFPISTPSQAALGTPHAPFLSSLTDIYYPPVSSIFLGYRRDQITHPLDGFGALMPAVEKLPFLGVLFSSSLFAGRAPEGHVGLTVMVGGTRQPELTRLSEAELHAAILPALNRLFGITGAPVFSQLSYHAHAIPQYNLGYDRYLNLMTEFEQAHPGIHIAGHVRDGIAVPACIQSGETAATRLLA